MLYEAGEVKYHPLSVLLHETMLTKTTRVNILLSNLNRFNFGLIRDFDEVFF